MHLGRREEVEEAGVEITVLSTVAQAVEVATTRLPTADPTAYPTTAPTPFPTYDPKNLPTPVPTHPKTESTSSDPARQSAGYTDAIARGMYVSDETIRSILADPSVAELVELLQAEPSSPRASSVRAFSSSHASRGVC